MKNRYVDSRPQIRNMDDLNFFQIEISYVFCFMYEAKSDINPRVFTNMFINIHHNYPNKFSENSFKQTKTVIKITNFAISFHGPKI